MKNLKMKIFITIVITLLMLLPTTGVKAALQSNSSTHIKRRIHQTTG